MHPTWIRADLERAVVDALDSACLRFPPHWHRRLVDALVDRLLDEHDRENEK